MFNKIALFLLGFWFGGLVLFIFSYIGETMIGGVYTKQDAWDFFLFVATLCGMSIITYTRFTKNEQ